MKKQTKELKNFNTGVEQGRYEMKQEILEEIDEIKLAYKKSGFYREYEAIVGVEQKIKELK